MMNQKTKPAPKERPPITLEFNFRLNDKVLLQEISRPGKVDSISIDCLGITYRVSYWDEGERRTVWVHEDEIKLLET